jgi:cold shock CspA family protein
VLAWAFTPIHLWNRQARRKRGTHRTFITKEYKQMPTTCTIKKLISDHGYGFIPPDGADARNVSGDAFFNFRDLADTFVADLAEGVRVEFHCEPNRNDPAKLRAKRVRIAA